MACSISGMNLNFENKDYVDNLPDNLTLTDKERSKWCEIIDIVKVDELGAFSKRIYGWQSILADNSATIIAFKTIDD